MDGNESRAQGHITSLIDVTSTGNKYSNSRHIRDVSRQIKTITRNSKMTALFPFIAYVQITNSVRHVRVRVCNRTQGCVRVRPRTLKKLAGPRTGPRPYISAADRLHRWCVPRCISARTWTSTIHKIDSENNHLSVFIRLLSARNSCTVFRNQ